jgi:biotin carboxylase
MTVAETVPFRDKEAMKRVLDAAGIRTPRHARAATAAAVREAAERIGYPLIVKPIAGAGSADTPRVDSAAELEGVLARLRHVPEVSVEEFVEGEEFTFDTVSIGGEIAYFNIGWYRPRPLVARTVEWISPQTVALRNVEADHLAPGRAMGRAVLEALAFRTGFSHMEWYLKPDGEAVFGEIGGRAPGGRLTHAMNYSCDADIFAGWAEAVCHGRLHRDTHKKFNAAVIFKRAEGEGRIQRVEGLQSLMAHHGEHVAHIDLVPIGAPRRDYRQVVTGDGWIVVRHPDLEATVQMADAFANELRMFAG